MSATKRVMEEFADAIQSGNLNDNTGREFDLSNPDEKILWTIKGFCFGLACGWDFPDSQLVKSLYTLLETLDNPEYENALEVRHAG